MHYVEHGSIDPWKSKDNWNVKLEDLNEIREKHKKEKKVKYGGFYVEIHFPCKGRESLRGGMGNMHPLSHGRIASSVKDSGHITDHFVDSLMDGIPKYEPNFVFSQTGDGYARRRSRGSKKVIRIWKRADVARHKNPNRMEHWHDSYDF